MRQYIPKGSYQDTSEIIGVVLSVSAQKIDKSWIDASLDIKDLNSADIANLDGVLKNMTNTGSATEILPSGSYKKTCEKIKVILSAKCQKLDNSWQKSQLEITDFEYVDIANIDGELVNKANQLIKFSMCDMLKIGIGSSSSHTLAPWLSAKAVYKEIKENLPILTEIKVALYGSLASVGRGHYTSVALPLGLLGKDPANFNVSTDLQEALGINSVKNIGDLKNLNFGDNKVKYSVDYSKEKGEKEKMKFSFTYKNNNNNKPSDLIYYSYGGGSFGKEASPTPLYAKLSEWTNMYRNTDQLIKLLQKPSTSLSDAIYQNEIDYAKYRKANPEDYDEKLPREENEIIPYLKKIAVRMGELIYDGCNKNRDNDDCYNIMFAEPKAKAIFDELLGQDFGNDWKIFFSKMMEKTQDFDFEKISKLTGVFALAVGEQNAALKNVVTAPTNGACGTVPAVLYYYIIFHATEDEKKWLFEDAKSPESNKIVDFLLTVSTVGGIVKSNANIAGGIGGCQAEIGTASAMAAGAITNVRGGDTTAVFQAAELALETHLGSTCDPVGGLVEIPCISRNLTAAVTAISVSQEILGLEKKMEMKISFDEVVRTMQNISEHMPDIYKETSVGGLARIKLKEVMKERPDLFEKDAELDKVMGISMFRSSC